MKRKRPFKRDLAVEQLQAHMEQAVPTTSHARADFISFSGAVKRLAKGMWGGLPRPVPVARVKRTMPNLSVSFGPRDEQARKRLTAAAREGELAVYVRPEPQPRHGKGPAPHPGARRDPLAVPVQVLKRLPTARGGLHDHPVRVSIKMVQDEKLFDLLRNGSLVVEQCEFAGWYQSERKKGQWASQQSSAKPRRGRPTAQTGALRRKILAVVNAGDWSRTEGVTRLKDLLVKSGLTKVPSTDTLARLVTDLSDETGHPMLYRASRRSRRQLGERPPLR